MDKNKEIPDCFKVLTLEELAEKKTLNVKEIEAALEKGRKEMKTVKKYFPCGVNSDLYYK